MVQQLPCTGTPLAFQTWKDFYLLLRAINAANLARLILKD